MRADYEPCHRVRAHPMPRRSCAFSLTAYQVVSRVRTPADAERSTFRSRQRRPARTAELYGAASGRGPGLG